MTRPAGPNASWQSPSDNTDDQSFRSMTRKSSAYVRLLSAEHAAEVLYRLVGNPFWAEVRRPTTIPRIDQGVTNRPAGRGRTTRKSSVRPSVSGTSGRRRKSRDARRCLPGAQQLCPDQHRAHRSLAGCRQRPSASARNTTNAGAVKRGQKYRSWPPRQCSAFRNKEVYRIH
jgi:hypothetical protein